MIGVIVMLESMGLPLPAETLIISSALYCAATHRLDIGWVAVAAVLGAIMGDNFGYLIGRTYGYRLLERHGSKVYLTSQRLMLGRYLFRRHGGKVVFFGRFIAILRVFVALLAGANHMPWHTFLLFNALGGIGWAGGYAYGAYFLGHQVLSISGPVGVALGVLATLVIGGSFVFLKKNERRLTEEATREAEREQQKEPAR
ncbi:SNARE associated Golgi protein [Gluconacetobacter diazotrophicus PA1 5]|nr:SNARE associated Golgi protein [Gluconacetobacter diazotrophicus PA1 5]TWB11048.1 membrane protein DedA with SNARE-associated domain [Gluconacetobacter diazotrophicus]